MMRMGCRSGESAGKLALGAARMGAARMAASMVEMAAAKAATMHFAVARGGGLPPGLMKRSPRAAP
jgi:hypothetical protein